MIISFRLNIILFKVNYINFLINCNICSNFGLMSNYRPFYIHTLRTYKPICICTYYKRILYTTQTNINSCSVFVIANDCKGRCHNKVIFIDCMFVSACVIGAPQIYLPHAILICNYILKLFVNQLPPV